MSTIQHSTVTGADLHGIVAFTAASVSARNALSVVAGDIGKVCQVTADNTFYVLTAVSPAVWAAMTPALAAVATSGAYADLTGKPTLATVATSGSYVDLTNKPTIPAAYTLPVATASVLGGVKAGSGVTIDGAGVISATSSTPAANSLTGTALASNVVTSSLTTVGPLTGLSVTGTTVLTGAVTVQSGIGVPAISGTTPGMDLTLKAGDNQQMNGFGSTGGNVYISGGIATYLPGGHAGGSIILSTAAAGSATVTERLRILANGAWSVGTGGTNYGTSGQVLTSNGNAAPTWQAGGASLSAANTWTAGQRGAVVALTAGATVTPDFAASNNFSLTANQNFTLANPTNLVAGQSGIIAITQDATGSRVISWGSVFKAAGGTKPVLSTAANAVDYLSYYVETTGRVFVSITSDVK